MTEPLLRAPLCPALGHPVGDAAFRDRLLRHDVLAPLAGLASCQCVDTPASHPARASGGCRQIRLEPGFARFLCHCGKKGGAATGPNPTDRGKSGTKRHVVVDRAGTPLGISLSGANRHDSLMLAPTLDAVLPVHCGRCTVDATARGAGRTNSMPTKPMIIAPAVRNAASAPSCPELPAAAWISASAWDDIAGWWGAHWSSSTASAGSRCIPLQTQNRSQPPHRLTG